MINAAAKRVGRNNRRDVTIKVQQEQQTTRGPPTGKISRPLWGVARCGPFGWPGLAGPAPFRGHATCWHPEQGM
ncbi:Hypothetical predicted protein [Cloeon dipterum]|uniref:Uncharacterized protein n=1 Tax=Cloeon dipterum TaxID=197152 RepID=A0A8S1CGH9_9INSE|nr:Hypothetical predicted protein [Cloeon dipterum]